MLRLARTTDPRRLPEGKPLAFPRDWLRSEPGQAKVAGYRGSVRVTAGGQPVAPAIGLALGEQTEIATAANSFVTLALPNGSRVALPSQSRMRIALLQRLIINGAVQYRFDLQRGRIDTRVAPLKQRSGSYRITTPISMTAVRGTDYNVFYDDAEKRAGTAVFDGAVAVSAADGANPAMVAKSFGSMTGADGRSAMAGLLPAPMLVDPGRAQLNDLVSFDAAPVPGAARYHLLLAGDAGFVDAYHEQYADTPHFEIADVPDGNQFVRISAVAASGLAGERQTYSFRRTRASIHASATASDDGYRFKWTTGGEGMRQCRLNSRIAATIARAVAETSRGLPGKKRHSPTCWPAVPVFAAAGGLAGYCRCDIRDRLQCFTRISKSLSILSAL